MPLRSHAGTWICQYERRALLSRRNNFLNYFCIGRRASRIRLEAKLARILDRGECAEFVRLQFGDTRNTCRESKARLKARGVARVRHCLHMGFLGTAPMSRPMSGAISLMGPAFMQHDYAPLRCATPRNHSCPEIRTMNFGRNSASPNRAATCSRAWSRSCWRAGSLCDLAIPQSVRIRDHAQSLHSIGAR